jgi:peptide/nickel transport system permease protein
VRTYIIRRVLLLTPTFFLVTILVFLSVRFLPGDAVDRIMYRILETSSGGGTIDRAELERRLGLDVPVHVQYVRWMGGILLRGDLGKPLLQPATVGELIRGRMLVTIELGLVSILIGLLIGVPIGIFSAVRQNTLGDYASRSFAIFGLATPNFWLATIILVFPGIWWGWAPPLRLVPFGDDPLAHLSIFIAPGLILGTYLAAGTMRMTRTMMLEVLRQDYIRTAWAKGLKERVVILRHAIKNALIPVVTLIGLQLPILVGGAVIMEQMFSIPGLGKMMIDSLADRDYPLISGINLFFASAVMTINLFIDLLYSYLDPRIHYN